MPLNRRSVVMLAATGNTMNQFSTPIKGDSYYGYSDGLHTIQPTFAAFEGRVHVQGTLVINPASTDWFDINPTTTGGNAFVTVGTETYVDYPDGSPYTGSEAYTFQGNFAHVRLYMDRRHIGDGNTYVDYGQITRAVLSA